MTTEGKEKPLDINDSVSALRAKIAQLRADLKPLTIEAGKPHSRVTPAERAKIIKLHQKGFGCLEISTITGRPRRTVSGIIQRAANCG